MLIPWTKANPSSTSPRVVALRVFRFVADVSWWARCAYQLRLHRKRVRRIQAKLSKALRDERDDLRGRVASSEVRLRF